MFSLSELLHKAEKKEKPPYTLSQQLVNLCGEKQIRERSLLFHGVSVQGYDYEETIEHRGRVTGIQPEWVVGPVELYALEDFHVHSSTGVLFSELQEMFFVDFAWGWGNPRSCKMPKFHRSKISKIETNLPIYVAAGHGYHGIVDDLSAILLLRRRGESFKIALEHGRKWMEQLLEAFGFASTDILRVERNSWLKAPYLLAITKPAFGEFVHPELLKELRNAALDWHDDKPECDKLYISREKAASRAFSNERQLRELFQEAGFSSVILEEIPVSDQIKLFVNAKQIAGLHGAGLTNLVWNQKEASVLELYQSGKFNSCYSAMAASLGHSYSNLSVSGPVSDWSVRLKELLKPDLIGQ